MASYLVTFFGDAGESSGSARVRNTARGTCGVQNFAPHSRKMGCSIALQLAAIEAGHKAFLTPSGDGVMIHGKGVKVEIEGMDYNIAPVRLSRVRSRTESRAPVFTP